MRTLKLSVEQKRFLMTSIKWSLGIAIVCASAAFSIREHYRIGIDFDSVRCLPSRVYLIKLGAPHAYHRGNIIAFIPPHGKMLSRFDGQIIVKEVGGVPGDIVVVKNDLAKVNGKIIGSLVLNQKLGKLPGAFDRTEVVPPRDLFMMGTAPRSYDSRYWGFLPQSSVIGTAVPLL